MSTPSADGRPETIAQSSGTRPARKSSMVRGVGLVRTVIRRPSGPSRVWRFMTSRPPGNPACPGRRRRSDSARRRAAESEARLASAARLGPARSAFATAVPTEISRRPRAGRVPDSRVDAAAGRRCAMVSPARSVLRLGEAVRRGAASAAGAGFDAVVSGSGEGSWGGGTDAGPCLGAATAGCGAARVCGGSTQGLFTCADAPEAAARTSSGTVHINRRISGLITLSAGS